MGDEAMPTLSRRHLVTTAAALPALAIPALASDASGSNHAEAELIALGDELLSLWPEFVAARDAFNESGGPDGRPEEIRYSTVNDELSELDREIMEIPSRTLAGLRVKVMAPIHWMDPGHWDGSFDDLDGDGQAARSLIEAVCAVTDIDLAKHLGVVLS
jgi:hypothetical protein